MAILKSVMLLVFLLLVVALGLVAWDNWSEYRARGADSETMRALHDIGDAVDGYLNRGGTLPELEEGSVQRLFAALGHTFHESLPVKDGWGQDIRVLSSSRSYVLISCGSDRRVDDSREPGIHNSRQRDIVWTNGYSWSQHRGYCCAPELDPDKVPFSDLLATDYDAAKAIMAKKRSGLTTP